ncbi:hypothetical protein QJS10_CPA05g00777 [Acorus calamus]|uniref:Uncharacterized protein n=1 Tax=Acorus calamus TaxID=4465 RepID=A0AAV9ERZ9_ACOCL|nr:hypothetical protein QJS10_CPA05g00777 [Acorus calamus]
MGSSEDMSVVILASDLGIDARSFLSPEERDEAAEVWHDCPPPPPLADADFSDLEALQAFRVEGSDRSGNRIFRIVGKYFPGCVVVSNFFDPTPIVSMFAYYFLFLYWKIKYISRLQYLSEDIKKGQVEIPEFVQIHDDILENRPLTDYGIEPDPLHLTEVPAMEFSMGRYEEKWSSRAYM